MKVNLSSFINNALNLIFPNVCGICNKLCNDDLCKKCEIEFNKIAKIKNRPMINWLACLNSLYRFLAF